MGEQGAAGVGTLEALLRPEWIQGMRCSAIKADTKIYPSPEMMGKLFALEAMPLNIDRVRTRVWNTIRTGK